MADSSPTSHAYLRFAILTTPSGLESMRYLVSHLDIAGVWVDHGPWGRPPRTVARRIKRQLRHTLNRFNQPGRRDWASLNLPVIWTQNINSQHARDTLVRCKADLGIIVGGRIIERDTFTLPRLSTINKHSSLLPRHRGLAAEYWCLYHEELDALGVTVHFVDTGCDTGPILVQQPMTFENGDTPATLRRKSDLIGRDAIIEAVRLIERTATPRSPQDNTLVNGKPTPQTDRQLRDRLPKLWERYAA